mmetsp:Transcript_35532/g.105876  ORF Transcript_35532/g.105876 Transcript_35532/m.105876 type:complete len:270 (-) Transcript_35532:588-1397(-)
MTAIRVSERVNEFASTRVSADWRKGMWTCCRPASVATHWRMHSCSTCSDALISAPSLRRSELCVAESSFLSEPAQSTRVSTAAGGRRLPAHGPSAADEQSSIVQTAWERDETALAPVACVARRDFAVASAASSSLEEVKSAEESLRGGGRRVGRTARGAALARSWTRAARVGSEGCVARLHTTCKPLHYCGPQYTLLRTPTRASRRSRRWRASAPCRARRASRRTDRRAPQSTAAARLRRRIPPAAAWRRRLARCPPSCASCRSRSGRT